MKESLMVRVVAIRSLGKGKQGGKNVTKVRQKKLLESHIVGNGKTVCTRNNTRIKDPGTGFSGMILSVHHGYFVENFARE